MIITRGKQIVGDVEEPYRIQLYIRRKGETILDGTEYKTEGFSDREELLQAMNQFIDDTLEEDDEYIFRNAESAEESYEG